MDKRVKLIPKEGLDALIKAYEVGVEKYAVDDWKTKYTRDDELKKIDRHFYKYAGGAKIDPDGQHHLAAVAFHCMSLIWRDAQEVKR